MKLIGDNRGQRRDTAGILKQTISLSIILATDGYPHNQ